MKTKVLILFGLCAIGLCSWKVQSINLQATSISINNVTKYSIFAAIK